MSWLELPWREWQPTISTLHMWLQIVGKVRMALTPPLNHWWHITLFTTVRGLTTSPIPYAEREFQVDFDFIGHRLLVTGTAHDVTTLYAIDCRGRVKTLTDHGPLVEGGIEVAPRGFGRFGGRLIGLDELHGPIYAFKPNGSAATLATPPLASGPDIGVESLGFVPRLKSSGAAFLADRGVPGNPHPGTDSILRLTAAQLGSARVRAGDLLVVTEGGAETIVVRCRKGKGCSVRRIGAGPAVAHAEGHISFLGIRP